MNKVLVLGEDTRSFLSVIRSLGAAGYLVDVVCYDNESPAITSKYVQHIYRLNYQAYTQGEWLEAVVNIINNNHYDIVLPCDERAIFPLNSVKTQLPPHTKLGISNQEVLDHLFDKQTTKDVAVSVDVPVAKGEVFKLKVKTYSDIENAFGKKFVVKPMQSFSEEQLSKRGKVEIIENSTQFNDFTSHVHKDEEFLVEQFFEGTGEGVSLLAVNGKVQYLFAHTRVNEPATGGGSSYRKSIPVDEGMANACIKMCKATNYTGVGMFEFKRNTATQAWILIEVNARFWGSLPLAIFAGVDFPRLYAEALLGKLYIREFPNTDYKLKRYSRSLTSDIYDIKSEFEYYLEKGKFIAGTWRLTQRLLSFGRFLIGTERIDSYSKKDKAPFNKEVTDFYKSSLGHKLKRSKPVNKKELVYKLISAISKSEDQPNIKFVCYGNIMRSPLAAIYLEALCKKTNTPWHIDSFGFHQNEKRSSPEECKVEAKNIGLDIDCHKSKWLKQTDVNPNDIIIVFDYSHELKLAQYYQTNNIFNLADFIPAEAGHFYEISDPYGKGEKAVEACYKLITSAIDTIFRCYKQRIWP